MSDSLSRSSSRQGEEKAAISSRSNRDEDADNVSIQNALEEMERLAMEESSDGESDTNSNVATAAQSKPSGGKQSPPSALNDQSTAKSHAESPQLKQNSEDNGKSSLSGETPRKSVGFSKKPEVIQDEDQSASPGKDESPLVVSRGKSITMQRSGDMIADRDSPLEDDYTAVEEENREVSGSEQELELEVQEQEQEQRPVDERAILRRRRIESAKLRRTIPPPETIDHDVETDSEESEKQGSELKSSYAVSDEDKIRLEEQQSRQTNRKKTKREREEEELRKKKQENQEIFESWLMKKQQQKAEETKKQRLREERLRKREDQLLFERKRREEMEKKERRREREEKLRARNEKEEKERMRFEESEAYQKWWADKSKQLERERRLEEERYKELNELKGIRSPSEERRHRKQCERAFRQWKLKKAMQEEQERETIRENTRLTRLIAKHVARTQELEAAIRENTSSRYTDYYGYRY